MWDIFISHASEDKEEIALPLAHELTRYGYRVWLDKWELAPGDSLRQKIDEGLASSRLAVVVLSDHFLRKQWPQAELDALFTASLHGVRPIFPIWHRIDVETLSQRSPLMASRLAAMSSEGPERLAEGIAKKLGVRARPLEIRVDLRDLSIVGGVDSLANVIRESEDVPGSCSHRRINVVFEKGSRREEEEIARGIRWLFTLGSLTSPLRANYTLAETVSCFVRKYNYGGNFTGMKRLELWRLSDISWYTGVYLAPDEAKLVCDSSSVREVLFALGPLFDLEPSILARKAVPQILFEYFRCEQRDKRDYSNDAEHILDLNEWRFGPRLVR